MTSHSHVFSCGFSCKIFTSDGSRKDGTLSLGPGGKTTWTYLGLKNRKIRIGWCELQEYKIRKILRRILFYTNKELNYNYPPFDRRGWLYRYKIIIILIEKRSNYKWFFYFRLTSLFNFYLPTYVSIYLSTLYLFIYLSTYLPIFLSIIFNHAKIDVLCL